MGIETDIPVRIRRLLQMVLFIIGIGPDIAAPVGKGSQVVLFIIGIGTDIPPFILHPNQVAAFIIPAAYGCTVLPRHFDGPVVPVVLRTLLRAVRVDDAYHASVFIILHLCGIAKGIRLFRHLPPVIVNRMDAASFQYDIRDMSGFIMGIACHMSQLVGKLRHPVFLIIRHKAPAPACRILFRYPSLYVVTVGQVYFPRKIRNGQQVTCIVIGKGHFPAVRNRHAFQPVVRVGEADRIAHGIRHARHFPVRIGKVHARPVASFHAHGLSVAVGKETV